MKKLKIMNLQSTIFLIIVFAIHFVQPQHNLGYENALEKFNNFLTTWSKNEQLLQKHFLTKNVHLNFIDHFSQGTFAKEFKFIQLQNLSTHCTHDLNNLLKGFMKEKLWSLKVIDVLDFKPGGVFQGNLKWLGSFHQCKTLSANQNDSLFYQSKYCILDMKTSYHVEKFVQHFQFGVCAPMSCSKEDLSNLFDILFHDFEELKVFSNTSTIDSVTCQPEKKKLVLSTILVISVLSFLGFLVFIGTIYEFCHLNRMFFLKKKQLNISSPDSLAPSDYLEQNASTGSSPLIETPEVKSVGCSFESSLFHKVFISFSLYNNIKKILSSVHGDSSIQVIHGIRFLSMTWVILGHTFVFGFLTQSFSSQARIFDFINNVSFLAISSATVSVDSFFLMSGLLVSYLTLRKLKENNGSMNWIIFYLHRYWRLTPLYMLVLGFDVAVFHYLGSGPNWPNSTIDPNCLKNWWTNLLYINTIVNRDKMCMGWSWYLGNDMIFFLISPVFIMPLYKSWKIGILLTSVFLIASYIATGIISTTFKFPSYFLNSVVLSNLMGDLYFPPWTRIGPYLIGILYGFLMFKTHESFKMRPISVMIGWILSALIGYSVIYGLSAQVDSTYNPGIYINALYNTLSRSAWAVALGWLIFACHTGYGGIISKILSWNTFIPLGRMTYAAYLIHPLVIFYFFLSSETLVLLQLNFLIYLFIGHVVISYALAFIISTTLESPILALEKTFLKKFLH